MNRRGFLRSLAGAASAIVAAPAVVEASSFTPTWTGVCHGRWSSGQLNRGQQVLRGHGTGGKSIYGDMMLQEWMRTGKVGARFLIARHRSQTVITKTSPTTFEMSVTET